VDAVLSFKHQISLVDHRTLNTVPFTSAERAMVQAQLADDEGNPIGDWVKLVPSLNTYDTQAMSAFFNCSFDPIDDGNTEENFFNPSSPVRRHGPSSTCFPEFNFADQGDTENEFAEDNLGDASDGPGLQGSTGAGTWIEPRISLGQFRGRRVRLRFLVTGLKINRLDPVDWETYYYGLNPDARDDGWFIDDVAVTDTLAQPATVTVDAKDSTAIKGDWDFDGVAATCDCAPDDETAWMLPGPVADLVLFHTGGTAGSTTLSWTGPDLLGGTAVNYDTIRSTSASDFVEFGFCIESNDGADTVAADATTPPTGVVHFYLVRARHGCGGGALGDTSTGNPRSAISCV